MLFSVALVLNCWCSHSADFCTAKIECGERSGVLFDVQTTPSPFTDGRKPFHSIKLSDWIINKQPILTGTLLKHGDRLRLSKVRQSLLSSLLEKADEGNFQLLSLSRWDNHLVRSSSLHYRDSSSLLSIGYPMLLRPFYKIQSNPAIYIFPIIIRRSSCRLWQVGYDSLAIDRARKFPWFSYQLSLISRLFHLVRGMCIRRGLHSTEIELTWV